MIAQLVKKSNYYICSNCRMKQHNVEEVCWFCGLSFSNYEEEIIKIFEGECKDEIDG